MHTTFQFGDTAEFTWGKRNRLREHKLWLVDDDSYYRARGAGTHPSEAEYDGYIALDGDLFDLAAISPSGDDAAAPLRRTEADAAVHVEGVFTYVDGSLAR